MASRTHLTNKGKTRITAETGRVWVGLYQNWGASTKKEIKIKKRVWWNPFSWFTKVYWQASGTPPDFIVEFLKEDGQIIANSILNPVSYADTGYLKKTIMYAGSGTAELGNDARSVSNVRMKYSISGNSFELEHN